jgi:hypothetical protein
MDFVALSAQQDVTGTKHQPQLTASVSKRVNTQIRGLRLENTANQASTMGVVMQTSADNSYGRATTRPAMIVDWVACATE